MWVFTWGYGNDGVGCGTQKVLQVTTKQCETYTTQAKVDKNQPNMV